MSKSNYSAKHGDVKRSGGGFFRKFFKCVGILLLAVIVLFAGMIGYLTATEYRPADTEELSIEGEAAGTLSAGDSITMMTWNMGYGALGDNADFFMDGGSGVRTASEERVNENVAGVISAIKEQDPDIFFVQEADEDSTRSHHIDEVSLLREEFSGYESSLAYNYKVAYVPYPVPPLGKVQSGIVTFSSYGMTDVVRTQLPVPFKWPVRVANLKRAVLTARVPVEGTDKELVLMNLHLEAYDSGEGKVAQTRKLAEMMAEEAEKGNYVIVGGDFNQIFSSEDMGEFMVHKGMWSPGIIFVEEMGKGWQFMMDGRVPSCRSLDQPYAGADHENFQYYLIDGFIVSNNVKVESLENLDLGFVCSDHNPVLMKVRIGDTDKTETSDNG